MPIGSEHSSQAPRLGEPRSHRTQLICFSRHSPDCLWEPHDYLTGQLGRLGCTHPPTSLPPSVEA
jgi:hypothetical protein